MRFKKKLAIIPVALVFATALASCDNSQPASPSSNITSETSGVPSTIQPTETSQSTQITTGTETSQPTQTTTGTETSQPTQTTTESGLNFDSDDKDTMISYAISQVDALFEKYSKELTSKQKDQLDVVLKYVKNGIEKVDGTTEQIKTKIEEYYNYYTDAIEFLKQTASTVAEIKARAIKELDILYTSLNGIVNIVTADYITNEYNKVKDYINSLTDTSNIKAIVEETIEEFEAMAKEYAMNIIDEQLAILISTAKTELDNAFNAATAKITNDELRTSLQNLYKEASLKLSSINNPTEATEVIESTVSNFKEYIVKYVGDVITLKLDEYKEIAQNTLDEYKAKIQDYIDLGDSYKIQFEEYYNTIKTQIENLTDVNQAKELVNGLVTELESKLEDILSQALLEAKTKALAILDENVNSALEKLTNEDLKEELTTFYNQEKALIDAVDSFDSIKDTASTMKSDTEAFVKNILVKELRKLKENLIAKLDEQILPLIDTVEDQTIKGKITSFYNTEKGKIDAINSLDDAKAFATTLANDCKEFIEEIAAELLSQAKTKALAKLDEVVEEGIAKLPTQALKDSLNAYYLTEKAKLEAVDSIDDIDDTTEEIIEDTKLYIKELVASTIAEAKAAAKAALSSLMSTSTVTPYDFIPAAMKPSYSANLVQPSAITYDFSQFVNISSINYGGFGEQWNMVIENIEDSQKMNTILSKAEDAIVAATGLANAYYESKYSDTINFEKDEEAYTISINYDGGVLYYNVVLKTGYTLPLFGSVTPTINMMYNTATAEKEVEIILSDTNKLRYITSENLYEFGMVYGISKGSRTSYLKLEKDSTNVTGHIYEYVTVAGKDAIKSCADFYITSDYVSVVGNKADGMLGFTGYINELYKPNEGKLIGYEIREEVSKVQYNTLWFNLDDISGITSIKIGDKTDANKSSKSTADVYLNGSSELFTPTYNKVLTVKTSRKYDIEFRTRYFYSLDATTNEVVVNQVQIPMMFIQEDNEDNTNFTDYPSNMLSDNEISSSVTLSTADLNKILSDYDTLIDEFIVNKELMDSAKIINFVNKVE